MFDAKTYKQRRAQLKKQVPSGLLLFLGNDDSPMNYTANTYHFRQDSSFLYFFGLDFPGLAGIVDVDGNRDILFGDDISLEDIIWMGYQPKFKDRARKVGVADVLSSDKLQSFVEEALKQGRTVHYIPPYRNDVQVKLAGLLGIDQAAVKPGASEALIKAVISQRSIKSRAEVAEIESALVVSRRMYLSAMKMTRPGLYERDIAGMIDGIALAGGGAPAFPTILTINGQILHNHYHGNRMERGRLLVIDAGAESELHYASDITRTIPVSGKFTGRQKEIYEIVLKTQEEAIKAIKPGVPYRKVHLSAALTVAAGLKDLGLMKGEPGDAVNRGAHALFFPHGLGHMLGLDVHDMENLGENYVGYDDSFKRSSQFGLAYLRLAKDLQPGYALTVEPGIYFIPALIDTWRKEKKHTAFINYAKAEEYKDFGGVRIEDNVLVTKDGSRVLGQKIPKTPAEIEKAMAG